MSAIKTIKDLPSWFNLDHYVSREFSEVSLSQQIEERSICFEECKMGIWISAPENYLSWMDELPTTRNKAAHKDHLPHGPSIHPLNLINAQCMGEVASEYINNSPSMNEEYSKTYDALFSDTGYELNLSINLNCPDYQILQELKQLLPQYRERLKAQSPKQAFKKSDLTKILAYNILPLADLTLWSQAEGKHIPLSVLAVALFPDGSRGEEDIRKTIMPFMEKVTSEQYVYEWKSSLLIK